MNRSILMAPLLTLPLGAHAFYPVVDTGQTACYSNTAALASCPSQGASFASQDASYHTLTPSYTDNGDGTVTDNNTGLMWQRVPDFNGDGVVNSKDKKSWASAAADAASFRLGGYSDWRLPTIKELYTLMNFNGSTGTGDPSSSSAPADAVPYIDTHYFTFAYGDASAGDRYIDAQYWSSTQYVSTTMNGNATAFGVNFADGRIKGYGSAGTTSKDIRYVRYVRGGRGYATNDFVNNGDGTVTDRSTGLMWLQNDSGAWNAGSYGRDGRLNWQEALAWCEGLDYAGHADWHLPDAKELHSIVDYTRSLKTTGSAAINPLFQATLLQRGVNNEGSPNYPYYWTSTTHLDGEPRGARAVYFAFGEARGMMNFGSGLALYDVHGAGAQRSDLKSGDPANVPLAAGPQGDIQSIYNYARCVRSDGNANASYNGANGHLTLPRVDADGIGSYNVTMSLVGDSPVTFRVADATPANPGSDAVSGYDAATGYVVIPRVNVGNAVYGVLLKQKGGSSDFELKSAVAR